VRRWLRRRPRRFASAWHGTWALDDDLRPFYALADALFLDVFIREALRQLYFGGDRVPDRQLRAFAQAKWGRYQGYAGRYLTTNTEAWASNLGIAFRLRSGALSDPDRP
jgi:hypothetical protein